MKLEKCQFFTNHPVFKLSLRDGKHVIVNLPPFGEIRILNWHPSMNPGFAAIEVSGEIVSRQNEYVLTDAKCEIL